MHSIGTLPAQPSTSDEGQARRMPATSGDRAAGSRARELLAMLAALIVVAGVGAFMVACTQL
jgi:hypothetical protein